MAEFASPSEFDDELLSAYLDGELSAEERARVDERLQIDPAAAQLLEELRAISGAVQSLPREKLSRDLRASVLAGVESGEADEPRVVKSPYADVDRWAGVRRGLAWSALAIAAALVLMFVQPREGEDGAVADRADRADRANQTRQRQREVRSANEVPAFRAPTAGKEGAAEAVGGRARGGEAFEPARTEAVHDAAPEAATGAAKAVGSESEDKDVSEFSGGLAVQSGAAAAGMPSEDALAELGAAPASGAPSSAAGEVGRVQSFADGAETTQPAGMPRDEKKEFADVQVVELDLGAAAGGGARDFERVLAENSIALHQEALTPEAAEDDAAAALTAGNAILVEASPEQLKQILSGYEGRAVVVGEAKLSKELETLVRQKAAGDPSSANDVKALADWASRAADKAKNVRGASRTSQSGEAWRLLSGVDAQARRAVQAPVRVAPDSPASTSSAPAESSRFYQAAPAADTRRAAVRSSGLDRLEAATDADREPLVRVLFRFRPAAEAAAAAPTSADE